MNKTYRLIWNAILDAWVAVAEIVKARGQGHDQCRGGVVRAGFAIKPLALALMGAGLSQAAPPATELPTSGRVVAGQAAIAQNGATMNVSQTTARTAIDWQTFNVGSSATVNFLQPSRSAVVLNRVLTGNPSQIFGQINANGQVFLTNPGGIYFAPGSSANVGALVATTHDISNADFMAGNYRFSRNGATGSVTNEGELKADLGGYIALLAPEVRNQGVIVAQLGKVALAAGEVVTLKMSSSNTLASIDVEPATIAALVENGQAVQAPGGLIILSARAADQLQGSVVRNSGALEAGSLIERGGVIRLEGDHITLTGTSQINATGPTGGGAVYVGGEWQGSGAMHQATTVTMEQGAIVDVSATKVGTGGTAVLWSDLYKAGGATRVYGSLFARGGPEGGNGGRIETSGSRLDMKASADLSAPQGFGGMLLLDPKFIEIRAAGTGTQCATSSTCDAYTDIPADTSWVDPANLVSWLSGAYNVHLQATTDITVTDPIKNSGNSNENSLYLYAGRSINVNADITLKSIFSANANTKAEGTANRDAGAGSFTMAPGTTISTTTASTTNGSRIYITVEDVGPSGGKATVANLNFHGGSYNYGTATIKANQIDLTGAIQNNQPSTTNYGYVALESSTASRPVVAGGAGTDETTSLILNATDLNAIASANVSEVRLGKTSGTGGLTIQGTLPQNTPYVFTNDGVGGSITLASDAVINSNGRTLIFKAGTGDNGSFIQNNGATVSTVKSDNSAMGSLSIYADSVDLQGNAGSIVANKVSYGPLMGLYTNTASRPIVLGAAGAASDFALTSAELAVLSWQGSTSYEGLQIGNYAATGGLTLYGTLSLPGQVRLISYGVGGKVALDGTANVSAGSLTVWAGSGDSGVVQQNAGATVNASSLLQLYTDNLVLSGSANSITAAGGITVTARTANRPIELGAASKPSGKMALTSSELSTFASALKIGTTLSGGYGAMSKGGLTVSNAINLSNGLSLNQDTAASGGFISINAPITTGGILDIGSNNTAPITVNASLSSGSATRIYNNLSVGNSINIDSDTSRTTIQYSYSEKTTLPALSHGANDISVSALDLVLNGNWVGTGARVVQPSSSVLSRAIQLAGATEQTLLGISTTELGYLQNDTPSSVTIGRANGTGTITVPALTFDDPIVLRGGTITQTGAWTMPAGLSVVGTEMTVAHNISSTDTPISINIGSGTLTQNTGTAISSGSGTQTYTADTLTLNGTALMSGSGMLNISPGTAGRTVGIAGGSGLLQIPLIYFSTNFGNFSTISIGRSDGSGLLHLGAITSTGKDIVLTNGSGGISLTGALNAGANMIKLQSSGTVTDSGSGAVNAGKLALMGGGNFTLDSTSNAVGILAGEVGSLHFVNGSSTDLVIGEVNPQGIAATGPVRIESQGIVRIQRNIATSDTSSNAVVVVAGRNDVPGDVSGGLGRNIVIENIPSTTTPATITTGTGGRVVLYTGSIANSSGVMDFVGSGSGNFRYYSTEGTVNYSSALGSSGKYAVYREGPTVTVTANNASKPYDGLVYSGGNGVTYSGFVNGQDESALSGFISYGGTSQGAVNANTYTITPNGLSSATGYGITYANGSLTINPQALTLTANNASKTYGETKTFAGTEFTPTGLVNGETVGSVTLTSAGSSATASLAGGPYSIVPSAATGGSFNAGNYSITYANGSLTINPKALTLTASNASKTYGETKTFAGTEFTPTGLVNNETVGSVTLTSAGSSATASVAGGPYSIVPSAATGGSFNAGNYSITYANGSLTINKAHLTVTADNQTRLYGQSNPSFTQTLSGFVNGETLATSGVSGNATGSSTATVSTPPGSATVLASAFGLSALNYDFPNLVNGTLTITAPADPPPPPPPPPDALPPPVTTPPLNLVSPLPETPAAGSGSGGGSLGVPANVGGSVSVSLVRPPSLQETGVVTVTVPREMAMAGVGFSFPLPTAVTESARPSAAISVTTLSGAPLPSWLRFVVDTRTFIASATPDGAFPMQVLVTIGGATTTVVISARGE